MNDAPFEYRPLSIRALHAAGRLWLASPLSPSRRSPEAFLDTARRRTGLSDFGNPQFIEGFQLALRAYQLESRLHAVGWHILGGLLQQLLINRLRIEQAARDYPAVVDEPIAAPLFILGMPRTGSTLLQRLLAADPDNRYLRFYEGLRPVPPPALDPVDALEARRTAQRWCRLQARYAPSLQAVHAITPDAPEECHYLLRHSFVHACFGLFAPIPIYWEWLAAQNRDASYLDYRRQLQILQHGEPPRPWILKAPSHWDALESLVRAFPDACFVQTHRHPAQVIPSVASLVGHVHGMYMNDWCPVEYELHGPEIMASGVERLEDFRQQLPPDRFYDVHYRDLTGDPVTTVRGIYRHFRRPFTEQAEQAMRRYLAKNPKGKYGKHSYTPEGFGLSDNAIAAPFQTYIERYSLKD